MFEFSPEPQFTDYGQKLFILNECSMVSDILSHHVLAHVHFLDKFEKNQFKDSTIKIKNHFSCFSTK